MAFKKSSINDLLSFAYTYVLRESLALGDRLSMPLLAESIMYISTAAMRETVNKQNQG